MIRTTPFHSRLSELNTQGLYTHWQGHAVAAALHPCPEARVLRRPQQRGRLRHLAAVQVPRHRARCRAAAARGLVRDIRQCRPGQAQYTAWCDDRGFVMEDGVVFRHSDTRVPAHLRPPRAGWFADLGGRPAGRARGRHRRLRHARRPGSALARRARRAGARGRDAGLLRPRAGEDRRCAVTLSRTGYTGDLGFELTVGGDDARRRAGRGARGGRPQPAARSARRR